MKGERERLAYTRALESQNSCRRLQNVLLMIDDGGEYKKSRGLPHLDIRACGAAQGEEALDRSRVFQVPGSSARPPDTVLPQYSVSRAGLKLALYQVDAIEVKV